MTRFKKTFALALAFGNLAHAAPAPETCANEAIADEQVVAEAAAAEAVPAARATTIPSRYEAKLSNWQRCVKEVGYIEIPYRGNEPMDSLKLMHSMRISFTDSPREARIYFNRGYNNMNTLAPDSNLLTVEWYPRAGLSEGFSRLMTDEILTYTCLTDKVACNDNLKRLLSEVSSMKSTQKEAETPQVKERRDLAIGCITEAANQLIEGMNKKHFQIGHE